jgi:hypothetical protein
LRFCSRKAEVTGGPKGPEGWEGFCFFYIIFFFKKKRKEKVVVGQLLQPSARAVVVAGLYGGNDGFYFYF